MSSAQWLRVVDIMNRDQWIHPSSVVSPIAMRWYLDRIWLKRMVGSVHPVNNIGNWPRVTTKYLTYFRIFVVFVIRIKICNSNLIICRIPYGIIALCISWYRDSLWWILGVILCVTPHIRAGTSLHVNNIYFAKEENCKFGRFTCSC